MLKAFADQWALVTGASSGIGAEFARQLAARGMHLVLAARRESLLTQLAAELMQAHGTKTEIVVVDLARADEPVRLLQEIERRGITIELVINNAGFGYVSPIETTDIDRVLEMVRLNISALTELTLRVLPGMMERGHGGVINIASVAAFQPVGYMGAYAASKSYVLHFSEALWAEAREKGVTVTTLCPGTTKTDFFQVSGAPSFLDRHSSQDVRQVVKTGLKAFEKGRQYVVSGWKNYILSLLVRIATRGTVVKESMKFFRPKK
ncbi:MAG: SDR family oxidoreductase [Planctomycetes bacterium]|nr:SDR family oxidoreductase [Planctomycetota bacterium]